VEKTGGSGKIGDGFPMRLAASLLALVIMTAETRTVRLGEWGGPHARLTVRADAASVEFDCARGSIAGKIPVNGKGEFEVRGRYTPERGGPIRKGDARTGVPVKYRGTVRDSTLTLETIGEDGTVLGTFVLSRGTQARLMKCR
jgi:hypothetical protein